MEPHILAAILMPVAAFIVQYLWDKAAESLNRKRRRPAGSDGKPTL